VQLEKGYDGSFHGYGVGRGRAYTVAYHKPITVCVFLFGGYALKNAHAVIDQLPIKNRNY
jgi:hypothetical protein